MEAVSVSGNKILLKEQVRVLAPIRCPVSAMNLLQNVRSSMTLLRVSGICYDPLPMSGICYNPATTCPVGHYPICYDPAAACSVRLLLIASLGHDARRCA